MSIIQLLKDEHKEIKLTMEKLEKEANENHKSAENLFKKFKDLFAKHDKAETDVIYPVLEGVRELKRQVLKSYQSHHMAEVGIMELKLLPFHSESWGPKFSVIRDSILAHIAEEEELLFPQIAKYLNKNTIDDLAEKVIELRG